MAIEEEWDAHADNLELAWTSDDQQEVVASAFAAERSAVAIADVAGRTTAASTSGPVTTIVPGTIPAASLPGASTTTTSTAPRVIGVSRAGLRS